MKRDAPLDAKLGGRASPRPIWALELSVAQYRAIASNGLLRHASLQSGVASYYWQRQRLASGGWFNPHGMTAAHKTLPFGTKVRVTHSRTGRSAVVTINDRGPYAANRVIDLSLAAASLIGMTGGGVARVRLAVEGR